MKKILTITLALCLLTGCISFKKERVPKPAITIDTDYLNDDHCYLYYYETLNENKQGIYRNIYNCLIEQAKKVSIDSDDLETVQEITNYVLYDHPEIFYFDYFELQKQIDNTNFIPTYSYSKTERQDLTNQLETARSEFINSIDPNLSAYDKLKITYQYVIDKCVYVEGALDKQNITSSLLYGQTVCSGYVKAIQYLCQPLGINSAYIVGQEADTTDDEYHAWNLIELDNDYYYIDATWGDYDSEGDTFAMYAYFMFDSNDMLKLYKPTSSYKTTQIGTYSYFRYENLYNETYNKTNLAKMIRQYKNSSTTWMELKFSDSCYQEAKKRLIDQEEMFDLFNSYTNKSYSVSYLYYDNLNVLIFNQIIN